ncbi:MAG: tyrosine--tRNA ligase [Candidatus Saccharibacteria bacterium]|nr:tyrosine--tRNA ligase [Candidatus Saccharibacteria bacterium]
MTLSEELRWRGFVNQTTFDDISRLDKQTFTFYLGVDPSAPSMTIGNLATAIMAKHFAKAGHKAYLLVGGATGMIGDPDGKKRERDLKTLQEIETNKKAIAAQYETLFDGMRFELVDNYDWFKDVNYLDFLRDVGKHVPVRQMLARDFVQTRLAEDGAGISYAEFSYVLIQGYDFVHLNREYGVDLQLCGSDQWGNSIAGVDLIRRMNGNEAHVWSTPLVINQATGKKFGKSEGGAVWLDENATSVYQFYQFWLNVDDEGVEDYIKIYTELNKEEVDDIMRTFRENPAQRHAQKTLAYEVTKIVHGQENADAVIKVTDLLFGAQNANEINERELELLKQELPVVEKSEGAMLTEVLVDAEMMASKGEARRMLAQGAVKINGDKTLEDRELTADDAKLSGHVLLQRGKNDFALIKI